MRRDGIVALALAALAAALVALDGWRGAVAAVLLLAGTSAALAAGWPRRLGVASVVAGLALAPPATAPLMLLGTLAALLALGAALYGVPPRAWAPLALLAGLGAAVALAPALLAPNLADAASPTFYLLCAAALGPPCAAIAILRRERHVEIVG